MIARRLQLILGFAGLVLVATGCQSSTPADAETAAAPAPAAGTQAAPQPQPELAKARLADAKAGAQKWQADARLVQVGASRVPATGMTFIWDFGFYSPTTRSCVLINVIGGLAQSRDAGSGPQCPETELGEFMDSDQAMQIALKNGITANQANMVATASDTSNGGSLWAVIAGTEMVNIDGRTGAVVK